jgi:Ca-activated chloride channel homolog
MIRYSWLFSIFILTSPLAVLSQALPGAPATEKPYTVFVDVDLVLFNVTVLDDKDRLISGLTSHNFRVYEDGHEQEIRSFQTDDAPATVGLVIDNSGSMTSKRSDVSSAALEFVSSINPRDEIFVVNFNDDVSIPRFAGDLPFTANYDELRSVLLNIRSLGRTALYDAIAAAMGRLEQGKNFRKALVILSDGGDNASAADLDDIVPIMRQSAATLFTMGFYDASDKDRNPKVLRQLSELTGGESYVPRNAEELHNIWRRIGGRIRSQYTLGYVSTNPARDGLFRNVRITVVDKNGKPLKVRTRAGYVASRRGSQVQP